MECYIQLNNDIIFQEDYTVTSLYSLTHTSLTRLTSLLDC